MSDLARNLELAGPDLTDEARDWLARVQDLAPFLSEHRQDGEARRDTSAAVLDALRDTGITRMWISRGLGGAQVDIETGILVIEALARIDPAIAWQVGVQGAVGRVSDYLPATAARTVFTDNKWPVTGGVSPMGQAERVAGGYRLTGTWPFGSGASTAAWMLCTAAITVDGKVEQTDFGPHFRAMFVPREAITTQDTWHTLGLRGTGSNHYHVDDVFVPEEFTVDRASMRAAPAERPDRGYPLSYFDFGPFAEAPPALGIAAAALSAFADLAASKVPTSGKTTLAGSHTVQEKLARAAMAVYTARTLLLDAAGKAMTRERSDALSAAIRLSAAAVAENTTAAVDTVFDLAGTASLYETSPIERCFRDIHSATKHISMSWTHYEMVGDSILNGGPLLMRR